MGAMVRLWSWCILNSDFPRQISLSLPEYTYNEVSSKKSGKDSFRGATVCNRSEFALKDELFK